MYPISYCFTERFRAAASVLVGPRCPASLNCIDVEARTVVLLGKENDNDDDDDDDEHVAVISRIPWLQKCHCLHLLLSAVLRPVLQQPLTATVMCQSCSFAAITGQTNGQTDGHRAVR